MEKDKFLLAKSYFKSNEHQRSINLLSNSISIKNKFFKWYSIYMLGETKKYEEGLNKKDKIENRELKRLKEEMAKENRKELDGFQLYLYGIVLKELGLKEESQSVLIESVNSFPLNWSAWTELASLFTQVDQQQSSSLLSSSSSFSSLQKTQALLNSKISSHWMKDFFFAHLALELQQNDHAKSLYESLSRQYPSNHFILSQLALVNYSMREYDDAEVIFEQIIKEDPCKLDNMDIYSNILYVKEDRAKLSYLAQRANEIDRYRAETCCIIGNYFSMRQDRERAVLYFERALKLNSNFLSAWTLMGHEYIEMKNTRAAVEAYRRAVDINPRDYRAWYGLGQTYEILKMHLYSVYYYNKATTLRPYDPRMWCALGTCYDHLNRTNEAIQCYERAVANKDKEGIALSALARLYQKRGDSDKAAFYYQKNLEVRDQEGVEGADTMDGILYLATYFKNIGEYDQAVQYAQRLMDYSGKAKDEGKSLLRELSLLQNTQFDSHNSSTISLEDQDMS
eukprot:TRINITY_DN8468_c0_g1_i1.p1 TRINITY_DN8468_c0_g1~~TRINITY_DN8468_c0_g1_i1.p1  ORF type:complete len:598 (-),score=213.41 TRINITY_DN8468_c0_g1_i1:1459-2988(-)